MDMDQDSDRFRKWIEEAGKFQSDKCEVLESRDWDLVLSSSELGKRIDAALYVGGYNKSEDIEKMAKNLVGRREEYYVCFIYVLVILDNNYPNYPFACDVVCGLRLRSSNSKTVWIATDYRSYESWQDYIENNTLPKGYMYYRKGGQNDWCDYQKDKCKMLKSMDCDLVESRDLGEKINAALNVQGYKIKDIEMMAKNLLQRSRVQFAGLESRDLGGKIDAALNVQGYKIKYIEMMAKNLLGRSEEYYVCFIYVLVKLDNNYPNFSYACDVICVIRLRSSNSKTVWIATADCRSYESLQDYYEKNIFPKGYGMCYRKGGQNDWCIYYNRNYIVYVGESQRDEVGESQRDEDEMLESRDWDLVESRDLGEKIDAALNVVEYTLSLRDIEIMAKNLLGRVEAYFVRFIYVHVLLDDWDYMCDVVCVVRLSSDDGYSKTVWIATDCRSYESWQDYIENNTLPKGYMYYPKDGQYYDGCEYIHDLTPAAGLKASAMNALDGAAKVVGTVAGIAIFASVVALPVLGFGGVDRTIVKKAAVASAISSGYTTTRTVLKIADRCKHNQSISLSNAEARELWVNAVVHGFSTVTAGMTINALTTGINLISGGTAITVSFGLKVFRVNFILALDACFTDSPFSPFREMTITNFKKQCCFYFNIISPHHLFVETLKEINELTSFLNIIDMKSRSYLKLKGKQLRESVANSKSVAYIKDFIEISGKFIINMSLTRFESLIGQLEKSINYLEKNDLKKFDLMINKVGSTILSAFQEPWQEAKREVEKYGQNAHDLFKRSDLDVEHVRNIFFMLNDIEECYDPGSMKKLINLMNVFLSKRPVVACNRTEYLKMVKCFCLFLKKEVDIKIVEHCEEKKLFATLKGDELNSSTDVKNLKTRFFRQVIDTFNFEKCFKEFTRCSSSSTIASVEACGVTQYLFVEDKTELDDSEYLNILKEKTDGIYNFDKAVVLRRKNIIHIESIDGEALAIFFTQKNHFSQLEGVLICTEKRFLKRE